ncbi:MAG TPA: hypothetical protein VHG53_05125 [Candidatus Limnocylindria bacterium]|nr:hypothetical protein [Candidatus Limnocylindria bacterium]
MKLPLTAFVARTASDGARTSASCSRILTVALELGASLNVAPAAAGAAPADATGVAVAGLASGGAAAHDAAPRSPTSQGARRSGSGAL